MAEMQILEQGDIIDACSLPGRRRSHLFPTLHRLSDGRILLAVRRGTDKMSPDGNCVVVASADGGRTWETFCDAMPSVLHGVRGEVRATELTERADGTLLAVLSWLDRRGDAPVGDDDPQRPKAPRRLAVASSPDGGRSWGDLVALDAGAAGFPVLTGPPLALQSGGYLIPLESTEPAAPDRATTHAAEAIVSLDGTSTDAVVTIAQDPAHRMRYYDERLTVADGGTRLLAAFWTYDRDTGRDVDIHLSVGSADGSQWSVPAATGIQGQVAAPIVLPDGRLLLFYVRRTPPLGLRLVAGEGGEAALEGGGRWDLRNELEVYAPIAPAADSAPVADAEAGGGYAQLWQDMAVWSYGHPSAVLVEEGVLLLAYYAGEDERTLGVRWARVGV